MKHRSLLVLTFAVISFVSFLSPGRPAFAKAVSYDKYAPIFLEKAEPATAAERSLLHFPVYPFEVVRYPLDKGLVFVEKHHLDDKVEWFYDFLEGQGVTPRLNVLNPLKLKTGGDFDFVRILRQKETFPDAVVKGWIDYAGDDLFEVGSQVGMERIASTGFEAKGLFNYADRHREHFYGTGAHSSAGDGSVYEREETTIESLLGYQMNFNHRFDFRLAYHNVNISGGKDGGRGQFGAGRVFNEEAVPGLHGDSFLEFKPSILRDTRNQKENSTSGGKYEFAFSFNEGLNNSKAQYFKYQLEAVKYLSLGSERRVLAGRFYGEHNDKIGNHNVPFHQMPRLGGYGSSPYLSYALRGFDPNRFTDDSALLVNLEYRYTIWEYRDWKADTVFFWDEGQVFGEFSEFQFSDFRESYGLGLRISLANVVLLSIEGAHGDEGTNLYVKSSAPF